MTAPKRNGWGAGAGGYRNNGARGGPSKGQKGEGPADPSTDEPPLPWPEIVPLSETPRAAPFPLDVLPDPLREAVLEIASALNAPPDFAAVPLLVMASGAIGMSREVEIVSGHEQRCLLYAGIVGDPGAAKSPALNIMGKPTRAVEQEYRREWDERMKVYKEAMKDYTESNKSRAKDRARLVEPERPILRRAWTDDATAEAIIPILRENPRGVVSIRDELSAWVCAMDQYKSGKGAEKQLWLSGWSNTPISVDRKTHHADGPLTCAAPFVSVIGCLTPDGLKTIRGDGRGGKSLDDGFIDRVLLSFPDPLPARGETWQDISAHTAAVLDAAIRSLFSLEMVGKTRQGSDEIIGYRPLAIGLTQCCREAWKEFTDAHADQTNAEDFPACLKGTWFKLRGYCGRIALILHYLQWACGGRERADDPLDGNALRAATRIIDYFKDHARKAFHVMDRDPALGLAVEVCRWIRRKNVATFSRRDAHRGPLQHEKDVDHETVFKILCDHGHIRAIPRAAQDRPGRPPSPCFEVNPACLGESPDGARGG